MRLYHGMDILTAARLLAGESLNEAQAAALKAEGPAGFFLALDIADAEFFALRQSRGPGAVVFVEYSSTTASLLFGAGMIQRPVPRGMRSPHFLGDELFISPALFSLFNDLRRAGEVHLSPAP